MQFAQIRHSRYILLAYFLSCFGFAYAQALPELTVAALKNGTVNWELETIRQNKLDEKNGYILKTTPVAGGPAGKIAFQGNSVDMFVSDWLWVAAQRAEGKDYRFIPYSTSVGALMVKKNSGISTIASLKGHKVGIAGGELDKSWLIIRAYALKYFDMDLLKETEQVYGAPPLIFGAALKGEVDAAINFWHFQAKMKAAGMVELVSIQTIAEKLGLDPTTPLLGYVVKGKTYDANPELFLNFARSSRAAKQRLASDENAWAAIRSIMNAKNDAQFAALKAGFIAGIPATAPVNIDAANHMLALMAEVGGENLVGKAKVVSEKMFINVP